MNYLDTETMTALPVGLIEYLRISVPSTKRSVDADSICVLLPGTWISRPSSCHLTHDVHHVYFISACPDALSNLLRYVSQLHRHLAQLLEEGCTIADGEVPFG